MDSRNVDFFPSSLSRVPFTAIENNLATRAQDVPSELAKVSLSEIGLDPTKFNLFNIIPPGQIGQSKLAKPSKLPSVLKSTGPTANKRKRVNVITTTATTVEVTA